MGQTVFVLQHVAREGEDDENVKFIGVYSSQGSAEAAVKRVVLQPGFCDWPDGFSIDPFELGVDHWVEGFATVVAVLVPPRSASGEFQLCLAAWRPGDLYELGDVDEPETALFAKGDVVRAEERSVPGHGEGALVATKRVRDDA